MNNIESRTKYVLTQAKQRSKKSSKGAQMTKNQKKKERIK